MPLFRQLVSNVSVLTLTVGFCSIASAQVDVNPPRPNVLLLIDTSGSMEYALNPDSTSATMTDCSSTNVKVNKSRWIHLVETLTGNIANYACQDVARDSSTFLSEYQLSATQPPADYLYPIHYHRPMSGTCVPTPGTTTSTIRGCTASSGRPCSAANVCTFPQSTSGLLDAYKQQIRFGVMTFDTLPSKADDVTGTWTYSYGSAVTGKPASCTDAVKEFDVGARSATAPLWEGKMVAFGPPQSANELTEIANRNSQIQDVLLATRPFGATPIAGMLKDARDFFWNDPDPDKSTNIAPKNDPFVTGGCRSNYVILLTDGEPNMEMRDDCESTAAAATSAGCKPYVNGCCPFEKHYDIARSLSDGTGGKPVKVYVVGFAVSQAENEGQPVDCTKLTTLDLTSATGTCAKATAGSRLKACCTLSQIAYNGGTTRAYFADSVTELRTALATILDEASKGTTSRTFPVFASAVGSTSTASSYRFYTSFKSRISGTGLWPGVIERQRYVCDSATGVAELKSVSQSKGDDFAYNVNSNPANPARVFYSVEGELDGASIRSERTIRAQATSASIDGAGSYTYKAPLMRTGSSTNFYQSVNFATMQLDVSKPACIYESGMSLEKCHERYLKWLLGEADGSSENYHRCKTPGTPGCSLISDVYHSVPALVNRPSENLRDESYQRFALSERRTRPLMLYTSTNDGLLHAFKVASNNPLDTTDAAKVEEPVNNELWAFIPPAVLPKIWSEYPNVHQMLLDGVPVARDVAATLHTNAPTTFDRDLESTAAASFTWRTALVQSFGGSAPGYFALDITDPETGTGHTGPQFLWQLTTDAAGNPLFGDYGATPAITTLYFDPKLDGQGANPKEIAVALLPGGDGGDPPNTVDPCSRANTSTTGFLSGFLPRQYVPCYNDADGKLRAAARRARSLTIVRLDTGEIIRTFRNSTSDAPASIAARVTVAPLDAPITGTPVAYPGWTGAIADRAYVGDKDGSLWRIDLSSPDPTKWSMQLFFDAYYKDRAGNLAHTGQPIATPPILSTDENGQVTIAFSTGNQEDLVGNKTVQTYVYSLLEKSTTSGTTVSFKADVNWLYGFSQGERVTGPMTLFSNGLYFSTYKPPASTDSCDSGSSRIFGMHYLTIAPVGENAKVVESVNSEPLSRGGKSWLPKNGDATSPLREQYYDQTSKLLADGSVVFGVGIAQVPSCYQTGSASSDAFFGSTYYPTTTTTSATYQLVVQTGSQGTSGIGGTTKTDSVDLPPPDTSPRIDSWALVME